MGHDLVIRGGTVVDGTGAPAGPADIGIDGDRVTVVGEVDATAAGRVIEADGRLVTPGFVDIHSHLDAQIGWDPLMSSSCYHGVTSVVMGNCGVGFAPVVESRRQWLLDLMEGVEDIPGAAISACQLMIGDLYENREGQQVGFTINSNETVDRLLASLKVHAFCV